MKAHQWIHRKALAMANLGALPAVVYACRKTRILPTASNRPFRVFTRYARYPLFCRPATSDLEVFGQIFAGREYRCLDDVKDASFIIDCGANVGFSTAYFLSQYPRAQVIAVEPDPANFALLQKNVAPYGARCQTICSGVWSSNVGLVLSEAPFGDGREWARTVRVAKAGETPAMMAVDVGTILANSGQERISILKIDIEGSEAEVFSNNYREWLGRVDNLVIELHGARCKAIFHEAIKDAGFSVSQCDELTVCRRLNN